MTCGREIWCLPLPTFYLAMGWVIARAHTVCHIVLREIGSEVVMTNEQRRLLVLSRNDDDECIRSEPGL